MNKEIRYYFQLFRKVQILRFARELGSTKAIREFNVVGSTFYKWKRAYNKGGIEGLLRKRPIARSHPNMISSDVTDKILHMRSVYKLGSWRIKWYLERYHGIQVSESSVTRTLKRNGVNVLEKSTSKRALHSKRYSKTVPGHHVQVDVKFLSFMDSNGRHVRRFQYTAIDDATRIRALKIFSRHNQENAIIFIDYVVEKFPFRISTIRTDRGHEFQAKFHWHVEDLGMRHSYIKPRSPYLNGKVERSHLTDQREFYQLLSYKDDVDLNKKLQAWEKFYNLNRPHGAHQGMTPYEKLKAILK